MCFHVCFYVCMRVCACFFVIYIYVTTMCSGRINRPWLSLSHHKLQLALVALSTYPTLPPSLPSRLLCSTPSPQGAPLKLPRRTSLLRSAVWRAAAMTTIIADDASSPEASVSFSPPQSKLLSTLARYSDPKDRRMSTCVLALHSVCVCVCIVHDCLWYCIYLHCTWLFVVLYIFT